MDVVGKVVFKENGQANLVLRPVVVAPAPEEAPQPPTSDEVLGLIRSRPPMLLVHPSREDITVSDIKIMISNIQAYPSLGLTRNTWSLAAWERLSKTLAQPKRKRKILPEEDRFVLPQPARLALPAPPPAVTAPLLALPPPAPAEAAAAAAADKSSSGSSSNSSTSYDGSDIDDPEDIVAQHPGVDGEPHQTSSDASDADESEDIGAQLAVAEGESQQTMAELQAAYARRQDDMKEVSDDLAATQAWAEFQESDNARLRAEVAQLKLRIAELCHEL